MAIILVTRSSVSGGDSGGSGSSSGHTHSNLALLNSLKMDSSGHLWANNILVGERAVEVSYETTLTGQQIADRYLELPEDCDTGRALTLILESVPQRMGEDWEVIDRVAPEKDRIAWAGLGMERVAQAGDRISVNYYKKL